MDAHCRAVIMHREPTFPSLRLIFCTRSAQMILCSCVSATIRAQRSSERSDMWSALNSWGTLQQVNRRREITCVLGCVRIPVLLMSVLCVCITKLLQCYRCLSRLCVEALLPFEQDAGSNLLGHHSSLLWSSHVVISQHLTLRRDCATVDLDESINQ